MSSGLHRVCDILCNVCDQVVGWRYLHAHDPTQKYKEKKFILEVTRIVPEAAIATISDTSICT
jgi:hypothetical protein